MRSRGLFERALWARVRGSMLSRLGGGGEAAGQIGLALVLALVLVIVLVLVLGPAVNLVSASRQLSLRG